jgi:thiamine biosynthesis lipoprotein
MKRLQNLWNKLTSIMQVNSPLISPAIVHHQTKRLMGNRFAFSVVSTDADWAEERITAAVQEVSRIERLLTTFNEESQTNAINRNAGIKPVKVDAEVFNLIERSVKISELTQGAFDITYGAIDKSLWNFDLNMHELPDAETARQSVGLINYQNIILDQAHTTVFLKEKGMRIGFGGIGKGYAADRAKYIMQTQGVASGIVNAAGDLITWGKQPDGEPWTIAIADPNRELSHFSTMNISNMAVATSGNYEKFVIINGKRYAHTIDPKTGLPVSGIKSVTVMSPSAELADAMATPIMVMGVKAGLHLVNQLNQIACVILDDHDRLFTSKNINLK